MTNTGNGQPRWFFVDCSGKVLAEIQAIIDRAIAAGEGEQYALALEAIYDRLRKVPHNVGEMLFRLPALQMMVYLGAVYPLTVDYGIIEEKPIVVIRVMKDIKNL